MAGKPLFFIKDFVASKAEKCRIQELTELMRNYATVLVRAKGANSLYGEWFEDEIAVYNPPAEYAAAPTMIDSDAVQFV
ncbi:hypothetical protein [Paenirhodobacter sp.]|uniref:hypothetical protein n=1 Tax=Paenirhodobacter sp. TaxID=1965326 RepID=UPI003B3FB10A